MSKGSRILVLLAALSLGLAYLFPLWRISLEAPQYPEGLGMVIHIDAIEGVKQHDLRNINNLNHYIGMKEIVPDSIPELRIMPAVVAGLMLLGVVTAAAGRRKLLYGYVGLFLVVALVGLVDFWLWEYNYGHDLDVENAVIKIPGMSYQPPLIGSRQILNFKAHSWPGLGGLALILAGVLLTLVALRELLRGSRRRLASDPLRADALASENVPRTGRRVPRAGLGLVSLVLLASCGDPEPRPLVYGSDTCEQCLMALSDERRGAEMVTRTGRAYAFDSIECLAAYLQGMENPGSVHSMWVTDFSDPPVLVRVEEAHFIASPALQSPMGLGLTAFAREEDRDRAAVEFGGAALDWEGVRALVAERWPDGGPHRGHLRSGEAVATRAPALQEGIAAFSLAAMATGS